MPGLEDYGALLRSGQAIVPDYAQQAATQQLMALKKQELGMQVAKAAQQLHDKQVFDEDLTHVLVNPSADNISGLILKHPEYANEIKSAWDLKDKAAKQSDLTQLGEIYSAATAGKWDLAAKTARARLEADQAAGQADDGDEEMVKALESGDPVQQKAALGMIGVHLAAATGQEHFGQVYGALNKTKEGFTLGPGQTRYDADGNAIASVAPQQEYLVIPEGGKAIPKPGTGPDGASSPPVNIATAPAAAQEVGVTLSSAGLPAPVVAGFLGNFHVEGGYGGAKGDGGSASGIGQWHDERAANFEKVVGKPIAEASPTEQAQFVLWEMQNPEAAGMTVAQRDAILAAKTPAQAAALIDQNYERSSGQHRQQRMAAANQFASGAPSANAGDPSGTLYGSPKPKPTRMTPAEVAAEGLDPNIVYYRDANGVPQAVSGQDTRTKGALKAWPPVALNARSSNEAQLTNLDRALNLLDPKNQSEAANDARNAIGPGTGMLGDYFTQYHDPKGANFRALIGQIGGVIIKDISGAAVTAAEDERLKKWVPKVTDRPEAAIAKLHNLRNEIMQRNAAMDEAYSEDQGYRPFRGGSQGPVKVRSVQEAQKLPSGTIFITPDGRTMRKR